MLTIDEAAASFLASRRIAVTGVSRTPDGHGGNTVYKRLRDRGYAVFAVNPNATSAEGDPCFASLSAIPGGVDAVVIATRADRAEATMTECVALGIDKVWMHRSFGPGSVCESATNVGRQRGITVIDGGCPLMFAPVSDPAHAVMRKVLSWVHRVPATV